MIYLSYIIVFMIFYLLQKAKIYLIYAATAAIAAALSLIVPEPAVCILYSIALISEVIAYYKSSKK